MSEDLQLAQHPDADQLNAFVEGALPAQEREGTLAHLAECRRCREIVALAMLPEHVAEPVSVPVRESWFRGWKLAWPVAAALAAGGLVAVHLRHTQPVPAPSAEVAEQRPISPIARSERAGEQRPQAAPQVRSRIPDGRAAMPAARPQPARASTESEAVANVPLQARNQVLEQNQIPPRALGGPRLQQNNVAVAAGQLAQITPGAVAAPESAHGQMYGYARGSAQAAPAAAATTVQVRGAQSQVATTNANASFALSHVPYLLPSHLEVVSALTYQGQTLALDTAGGLFLSRDGGLGWTVVKARWKGRAVRLVRTSFPVQADAIDGLDAAESGANSRSGAPGSLFALSGVVRDASGAGIPGAALSVTLPDGKRVATTSDSAGRYTLLFDAAATGLLEVTAQGFTSQRLNLSLVAGKSQVENVTLGVGQVSESVTVTADTAASARKRSMQKQKGATTPPSAFEITTEKGELWSSVDGVNWKRIR